MCQISKQCVRVARSLVILASGVLHEAFAVSNAVTEFSTGCERLLEKTVGSSLSRREFFVIVNFKSFDLVCEFRCVAGTRSS